MWLILQNVKYLLLIGDYLKDEATPFLYNFYYEHNNKAFFFNRNKNSEKSTLIYICVLLMSSFIFKYIYK